MNNPEVTASHRLCTEIYCWVSYHARGDMPDAIQQRSA